MKKLNGKTTLILVFAVVLITAGGALAYGGRDGKSMGAQQMPNQQGQLQSCPQQV